MKRAEILERVEADDPTDPNLGRLKITFFHGFFHFKNLRIVELHITVGNKVEDQVNTAVIF